MSHTRKQHLTERERFSHYLRTGRILIDEEEAAGPVRSLETKFNPYHDPENGRFTFAPGGPRSLSNVTTSWGRHQLKPVPVPVTPETPRGSIEPILLANGPAPEPVQLSSASGISLSRTHRDFLSQSDRYRPKPNTRSEWEKSEFSDKAAFKAQYISGYRDAIKAAAERYDLPPELVASVAYTEVGGDGLSNDIAYSLRVEGGRDIPEMLGVTERGREFIRDLNRPRAETSFGPYNIQQRRAAEILGYGDINAMSETARRRLIPTTEDPVPATFMLAKHLSDLRDQDFPRTEGRNLTPSQLVIIATRYPVGPDVPKEEIMKRLKIGRDYLQVWSRVSNLLRSR